MPLDSQDFRKASLIELHDRGVVVQPSDFAEATAGWSEFGTEAETYGTDLDGSRPYIKELAAKILDPNLLAIRFVSAWHVGTAEEEQETVELTYSGSFTVWWAAERKLVNSARSERRTKRRDTLL